MQLAWLEQHRRVSVKTGAAPRRRVDENDEEVDPDFEAALRASGARKTGRAARKMFDMNSTKGASQPHGSLSNMFGICAPQCCSCCFPLI